MRQTIAGLPKHLPIDSNKKLVRDTQTRAVISTDTRQLKVYRDRRAQLINDKIALHNATQEIKNLKTAVQELHSLITTYIGHPNNV